MIDDLDGTESQDISTVPFGYGRQQYEIDLTPENAEKFEELIQPYIAAGRKVRANGTLNLLTPRQPAKTDPAQLAAIREWAEANGVQVNSRGRIPQEVRDAYEAAHAARAS